MQDELFDFSKLKLLKDKVIVYNMAWGQQAINGLVLADDDGKLEGIHPRWAKILAVGSTQNLFKKDDYVLIAHGRWTRAIKVLINDKPTKIFMVDNKSILLVSKEKPLEIIQSKDL